MPPRRDRADNARSNSALMFNLFSSNASETLIEINDHGQAFVSEVSLPVVGLCSISIRSLA
jgi:hypothetical protein